MTDDHFILSLKEPWRTWPRKVALYAIIWLVGAVLALFVLTISAFSETEQKTYILSAPLVEEIFQQLAREPYASVAGVIGKLQAEVQHQPSPPAPMPSSVPDHGWPQPPANTK